MMIEINNLNKYYPLGKEKFHALKDVNVAVEKGEMVSIEGPSGAGKSTLLHIIGLLDGLSLIHISWDFREVSSRDCALLVHWQLNRKWF